jgi:hypothetical protein
MSNIKVPASKIPKPKKVLLYPGDPLIGVLDPNSYIIVSKGSLDPVYSVGVESGEDPGDPTDPTDPEDTGDPIDPSLLESPSLGDIKLISKTMITDGNGVQYVEFKFNVKNHVGSEVIGVNGYGV